MRAKKTKPIVVDHAATGIGWARHSRHYSEGKQVAALEAHGCRNVARASEFHLEHIIKTLRPEDPEPVCVTSLARLAPTRDQLRYAIDAIHERGCWVLEISTGRTTKDAKSATEMGLDAADELTSDARAPTKRQARAMARKSQCGMKRHCGTCQYYSAGSRCQNALSAEYSREKYNWDRCSRWEPCKIARTVGVRSNSDPSSAPSRKTGDTSS